MSRRPYVREVPPTAWYFRHPRYLRYMAREVTSIFVGAYCVLLTVGVLRLAQGQASYEAFLQALQSPASIVFQLLAFAAASYHAVTWFTATQKAMPLQLGDEFVPGGWIAGAHFVGWGLLSAAILYFAGVF
jgi:fumarate reductase subunit C